MIFVDTWAWVGLAVGRDQYHQTVKAAHHRLRQQRRRFVTTDYVLSEVITYLYRVGRVGPVSTAEQFVNSLLERFDAGSNRLETLTTSHFRRAWQMRRKYHDKPDSSFVDFRGYPKRNAAVFRAFLAGPFS